MPHLLCSADYKTDHLHPSAADVTYCVMSAHPVCLYGEALNSSQGHNPYILSFCLFVCDQEHSFCAGNRDYVEIQEKKIYGIAASYGGIPAGEMNGERGYTLTFVIAYIRVSAVLLFLISVWLSELLITVPPANVLCPGAFLL